MRIVLDTNVVMSALLWRGTPHRLLEAIRQHPNVRLYRSAVPIEELTDVFTRPAATKQLAVIGNEARQVIADYIEIVELAEPSEVPRMSRDPDDDHVLACAIAANATLICSSDHDLLVLGQYQNIPILTAADALRFVESTLQKK